MNWAPSGVTTSVTIATVLKHCGRSHAELPDFGDSDLNLFDTSEIAILSVQPMR